MARKESAETGLEYNPLWYKDAIIYELHVRAFADSNSDGIGDFRGLTEKLDYLQDLGVTAIWLLPFYPSPLRDDGYDIADYTEVNPAYGTLQDVKHFVREAHRRGLRVITELVCNHTSDQHPWFQRARLAKAGSAARNFYVWSDTPDKYRDARIIFKDFESSNWSWDAVAQAYYWHRFYSHQPDLNFENPQVQKAILKTMEFWLQMGVDGLRLDAIPYLYEREGTNCENLPETHTFLKQLRRHVDERFRDRMLLAEANQWPEDAVAYFGDGDECHMSFHFPVMPRLFMSIYMEDRFPLIEIMRQTPPIAENCQWALFLRNHDELTLEMVTDEERDYMYRVYAQDRQARINLGIRRRLAPLLGNNRRRIELMNGLLFSLPGTPVIYYGDEIGMGDNVYLGDRNGVRTPMQWSADRNAGFSRANPQRLYLPIIIDPEYHYETVNVEAQQNNQHSLLWWMKRLIALRKQYKAFGRGSLEFLHPENRKVLAFVRSYADERILVLANLSRYVQYVELDLTAFRGMMPVELFSKGEFPPIGDAPYFITLGPHSFYWFALEPQRVEGVRIEGTAPQLELPLIEVSDSWERVLLGSQRSALERILPNYLLARRWFGSKARKIKAVRLREMVPLHYDSQTAYLNLLDVEYTEGDAEIYMLPLTFAIGERAEQLRRDMPHVVVARLRSTVTPAASTHPAASGNTPPSGDEGLLYDPVIDRTFANALLDFIANRRRVRGERGEVLATPMRAFRRTQGTAAEALEPSVVRTEQSNTSVIYGNQFILKLFRKLDTGVNPDLEIGRFLTEKQGFAHTPTAAGAIEYQQGRGEPTTLAILQGFVPNEGDAWNYTLDVLRNYYDHALTLSWMNFENAGNHGDSYSATGQVNPRDEIQRHLLPASTRILLGLTSHDLPTIAVETIGAYLESARLLGQRTAEMHLALAGSTDDPAFAPEPFSTLYQRSLYQSMRSLTVQVLQTLRKSIKRLPDESQAMAQQVLDLETTIFNRFQAVVGQKIAALRIRHHGDYHLGQVLYTGKDFVIIDFEGEPARTLSERRIKRSPLRDVAGMLRSFHYAAYAALRGQAAHIRPTDMETLDVWARFWYLWVGTTFLRTYLETAAGATFLPQSREELQTLLDIFLLEKAIYELGYELNNRPDWLAIPIGGILQLLEATTA